jgi:hypothetical protein
VTDVPTSDPTALTTDALHREIAHVRELYDRELVLIERQRVESKTDATQALNAAMTAAEKARSLEAENTKAAITLLTVGLSDMRAIVGALVANKAGGQEVKAGLYAFVGFLVSLIVIGGFVAAAWPK